MNRVWVDGGPATAIVQLIENRTYAVISLGAPHPSAALTANAALGCGAPRAPAATNVWITIIGTITYFIIW